MRVSLRLSAKVDLHQWGNGYPMNHNGKRDHAEGERDDFLGQCPWQTMVDGVHQVINRANAADAEPGDQDALVA